MVDGVKCDVAVLGAGLAGGLVALALAIRRPDLHVVLVEETDRIGGNHIWSFFDSDVAETDRWLVESLVSYGWRGYDVAFPGHARMLGTPYYSIESERLEDAVRGAMPAERILTGRRVLAASPRAAVLEDGTRIEAGGVIDARGGATLRHLDCGWQKFVGHELVLDAPHGLDRPIVMDATVEQHDGYRFVYCLPFTADRVFVEDTYYSEFAHLHVDSIAARIARYAEAQGWRVREIARRESGVLPVVMGGDFDAYWQSGSGGVAKVGARAALYHPTTGYSLPDAVRTAVLIAGESDLSGAGLHDRLRAYAKAAWDARGFYRMLDRMLFRAAAPAERYRVLERFYTLDGGLVRRFYAGQSTAMDKFRILAGKPPVPVGRAIAAIGETRR
ncbi:lycopene beta-cyclase CrtY [Sphingomonas montana]|uniref:lycopene beta-cyclase CrtY n=1 Tax=Sphingomonas montana TaxID=1843236 RepID=UPI00096EB6AB|nr:lycopene beta-cyclase CrtY [Sphingomonas montana]